MKLINNISKLLNKIYIKILDKTYFTLKSNEIRHYMENGGKNYSRVIPTLSVSLIIDDYFKNNLNFYKPIINGVIVNDKEEIIDITIYTNRVGILIGKGGKTYDELKFKLTSIFGKEVELNLKESPTPFGLDYVEFI